MQDGFTLLEEKVRKAADLVKRLRKENRSLDEDLAKARGGLQETEKRLHALERAGAGSGERERESQALRAELERLREEREEVRGRIALLIEALDEVE